MNESQLYQKYIKPELEARGFFYCRVEHPRLPDIYSAKNGIVIWIELKCVNHKSKDDIIRPDWRPGQLAWINSHKARGGDLIILCLWYQEKYYYLPPKKEYTTEDLLKQ